MPVMSINELTKRMNFNCIKTVLIAATAMISLNSFSQDLIARQAPIDRKLKSVDSLALQKQIAGYQTQIGQLLKQLVVAEVPPGAASQLQDAEETMADAISTLQTEIDSYNHTVKDAEAPARLRSSLSILNNFSKARRQYTNSQRLYESVMRSAQGQKVLSAEQEEIQQTYERIANSYQQLGIVAEQLQTKLTELENQLGSKLK